jgi:hypothetical protein
VSNKVPVVPVVQVYSIELPEIYSQFLYNSPKLDGFISDTSVETFGAGETIDPVFVLYQTFLARLSTVPINVIL